MSSISQFLLKNKFATRVANITDFTSVTLPIWCVIRPNGKSGSSTVGKGINDNESKLSALFECYELSVSEAVKPEGLTSSTKLCSRFWGLPSSFNGQQDEFVTATSLRSNHQARISLSSVSMNTCERTQAYRLSTIGLGAGFTLDDAIRSAKREILERYSCSSGISLQGKVILSDLYACVSDERLKIICQQLSQADYKLIVHRHDNIRGLIGYTTYLIPSHGSGYMVGVGYGIGEDPTVGLSQALLEANQGICVGVSGVRDDMTKSTYLQSRIDLCKWQDIYQQLPHADLDALLGKMGIENHPDLTVDEISQKLLVYRYPPLIDEEFVCCKLLLPLDQDD